MDITVLIPTIPSREELLEEACASVERQTYPVRKLIVGVDADHHGPAISRNVLLQQVETEWVAFLDDDDLLYPHHFDVLASGKTDVRASYCDFSDLTVPEKYINRPYNRRDLRLHGIFGITVLARTEKIRDAGMFNASDRYEDWSLWNRMADQGCTFEVLPLVTWTYRLTADSRTFA